MAGLTGNTNLISSSIQYVINVTMTIPTLIYIDRWGRRPLLIWGAFLMALWMFIVGGVMGHYGNPVSSIQGNSNLTWQVTGPPATAVIACTYLFVARFAPTWGPTAWVYVSEIFPLKYRAKANGLCAATNCTLILHLPY
jgi:MFS family permease